MDAGREAKRIDAQERREFWIGSKDIYVFAASVHVLVFALGRFNDKKVDLLIERLIEDAADGIGLSCAGAARNKGVRGERVF